MQIIVCPDCGKPFAVSDNPTLRPRRIRCPHEGCGFTDDESSFTITASARQKAVSVGPLFESAVRLAADPRLIGRENIDMIACNSSCAHSIVIGLVNNLLDDTVCLSDPVLKKMRFVRLEREQVSLDVLMKRLDESIRMTHDDKGNDDKSTDRNGPDYRSMYLDLQKAYERLESEKNNMRDRAKALAAENQRFREMLGL